ncbi:chromate transporter [Tissierella sp. MB52-C2]|uniref:chromate transporter n=1 Tax=Tissierella sp. MB52-C2 TaxID=3070999 RepID=UPI00280B36A5|nr:chromate transporter [Tissierella sp. MB52-C2]WMM25262.1 chromate transporter [Tissierella sp. MB52-C2]
MKENRLWKLFISTFTLSAFTFGGGFVIVSLYKKKFVEELNWLEEDEMLDISAIAQSSPGPIPVNASVILGYRIHGILGSIVAILGTIIPPFVIISLISVFYREFKNNEIIGIALQVMRAGVAAVILDVVVNLGKNVIKTKNVLYTIVMAVAFIATYFFNLGAMYIIFSCLGIGLISVFLDYRKEKSNGTSMDSIH